MIDLDKLSKINFQELYKEQIAEAGNLWCSKHDNFYPAFSVCKQCYPSGGMRQEYLKAMAAIMELRKSFQ